MRTILVDDHKQFLDALAALLRRQPGIELVGEAYDGARGLALAAELKPDLVLVDFSMPDMNGAEVAQALKSSAKPPIVVIVSNHDGQEYQDRAMQCGSDGYVVKSEVADQLLPLLSRLMG